MIHRFAGSYIYAVSGHCDAISLLHDLSPQSIEQNTAARFDSLTKIYASSRPTSLTSSYSSLFLGSDPSRCLPQWTKLQRRTSARSRRKCSDSRGFCQINQNSERQKLQLCCSDFPSQRKTTTLRGKSTWNNLTDRVYMDSFSHVPPGFRFHPTDEELVDYYLRRKVASTRIDLDIIKDVDLYKIEPWDLQEKCKIGTEEQSEWYFFSHKDKKYPTGTRTNRATTAGFWKATGRDKPIYSKNSLVGMRKTLVFYKGRAPNGHKSDWIMHEYRLETNEAAPPQEEGWVVCRVFKKRVAPLRRPNEHDSSLCRYDDHVSFSVLEQNSSAVTHAPEMAPGPSYQPNHNPLFSCKPEADHRHHQVANCLLPHDPFLQLPQLESPNKLLPVYLSHASPLHLSSLVGQYLQEPMRQSTCSADQQATTDWRVLDKFVASQLSHGDFCVDTNCSDLAASDNVDNASISNSSGQIELWK